MILEAILFLSLFHHKKKQPPVTQPPKEDIEMSQAMDVLELNARTIESIQKNNKTLRLEFVAFKRIQDMAITCFTDKDRKKFLQDVDALDKAVDEFIVEDELLQVDDIA